MSFINTASFGKKSKKKSSDPGSVEGLMINVAKNGFTASCMHESKSGNYQEPEKQVFTDLESLISYVRTSLAGAVKDEAAEPQPDTDSDASAMPAAQDAQSADQGY